MMRFAAVQSWLVVIAGFLAGPALRAQDAPASTVQYEISAAWMGLMPRGNVQTNSNRVDFVSDLGIRRMQSQAGFRVLMKPWDRGSIVIEFLPYRFSGGERITRSFRFGGVTYNVDESVTAKASLNYVLVGYQHDLVNRPRIGLAWIAAAAYIGVRASATSPSVGSAHVNRDIPLPLAGLALRYLPAKEQPWFSIRGEARGMTFGSY